MGAMMGAGVGFTIGFIFGNFSILRGGAGPRGYLATLSQYMISSAATFSFFLAIGSVIRNDDDPMLAARMQMSVPYSRMTQDASIVRRRWDAERERIRAENSRGL